jgi:hypothetical protein
MSKYTDAMDKLSDALMLVVPDGPEWVKIEAAMAELTRAERAETQKAFVDATRGLDDAVAKLKALVKGLDPNQASEALGIVNSALQDAVPVAENLEALLSGEPASALPGMGESNTIESTGADPGAPSPEPAPRPVREHGRSSEAIAADSPRGTSPDQMIEAILRREGGFADHPADRGGPTNFGITLKTLASWRKQPVDANDVRSMKVDEAREIYRTRYYSLPKINELPVLLQPLTFDMSINHGPGTAIKLLQRVLNENGQQCRVDGSIGDETVASAQAACNAVGDGLINGLVDKRIAFYEAIVANDESQRVFLKGWLRRAREFNISPS